MTTFGVARRLYENASRDQDLTYVNVLTQLRQDRRTFAGIVNQPPWNDPQFEEFLVEVDQSFFDAVQDGNETLKNDGVYGQPRWQVEETSSDLGSFADPTNLGSAFSADVALTDNRFIMRAFDDRPATTGQEISDLELNTSDATFTVYIKVSDENDVPLVKDDVIREIFGGQLMELPFGSSHPNPAPQSGETSFDVETGRSGQVGFAGNNRYRWVLSNGATVFLATIYGRSLRVRD